MSRNIFSIQARILFSPLPLNSPPRAADLPRTAEMMSVVQGVATNSDNNNNITNNITANASSSTGAGATEGGGMIVSPGRSARYVGILCVCVECTVLRV